MNINFIFDMQGGRTDTGRALRMARDEFFTANRGDRSGVNNVVILVSDGFSTEGSVQSKFTLRNCFAYLFLAHESFIQVMLLLSKVPEFGTCRVSACCASLGPLILFDQVELKELEQ